MPGPPKPLPTHLREWLEPEGVAGSAVAETGAAGRAPDGVKGSRSEVPESIKHQQQLPVVVISFGSSFMAPEQLMPALAATLGTTRRKMRFVLRMREPEQRLLYEALERQGVVLEPHEALLLPQIPQNDVLGHPAVAAFVTQVRAGALLPLAPSHSPPMSFRKGTEFLHGMQIGRNVLNCHFVCFWVI